MRRHASTFALLIAVLGWTAGPADAKRKAAEPKGPVVTGVAPMTATVGQQLTIRGRNFRAGRGRNGIGFKADGQPIVFVRSGLSTRRMMTVPLPASLSAVLAGSPKRFRLRVLTSRFGKRYTPTRLSPTIVPAPAAPASSGTAATPPAAAAAPAAPAPTLPAGATGSGTPIASCDPARKGDGDQDGDRLTDGLELRIGTDSCSADTDRDGVEDGYEYRSAIDLNDDEYQQPNTTLPFPSKLPYPNPLDGSDARSDFDGDLLSLGDEYRLWLGSTPAAERSFEDARPKATPLSYSDGLQFSVSSYCPAGGTALCGAGDANRRVPALRAADDASFAGFYAWAQGAGYDEVSLQLDDGLKWYDHRDRTTVDVRDVDFSGTVEADELHPLDTDGDGFLSDGERDADVDGLSNYSELHGELLPVYWTSCYATESPYPIAYKGTDPADADTDGDGVLDGADDQDLDDVPNMLELSRITASGIDDTTGQPCKVKPALAKPQEDQTLPANHADRFGWVHPFNPCRPLTNSRSCSEDYLARYAGPTWWALQ